MVAWMGWYSPHLGTAVSSPVLGTSELAKHHSLRQLWDAFLVDKSFFLSESHLRNDILTLAMRIYR